MTEEVLQMKEDLRCLLWGAQYDTADGTTWTQVSPDDGWENHYPPLFEEAQDLADWLGEFSRKFSTTNERRCHEAWLASNQCFNSPQEAFKAGWNSHIASLPHPEQVHNARIL